MKIDRSTLIKYISAAVFVALYITTFFTTSLIYPEYSRSVLSVSVSIGFLLSFYTMTYLFAGSKGYCIGFSVFFLLVLLAGLLPVDSGFIRVLTLIIWAASRQPIAQLWDLIDITIRARCSDVVSRAVVYRIYLIGIVALFYIVYFVSRYFKKRKLKKQKGCEAACNITE